MATDQSIWVQAKRQFLQDASYWAVKNRTLELIVIVAGISAFYLINSMPDEPGLLYRSLVGVAGISANAAVWEMWERERYFYGYSEGYQAGYEAAMEPRYSKNELSEEDKKAIDDEVEEGVSNARGFLFNRVNIYGKTPWK